MTDQNATRDPLPPPFPVGARIRYIGDRRVTVGEGAAARVVLEPGMEVTIVRVRLGERGTGRPIGDYDSGEQIIDRTRDGHSVYEVDIGRERPFGRLIHASAADEWQPVPNSEPR